MSEDYLSEWDERFGSASALNQMPPKYSYKSPYEDGSPHSYVMSAAERYGVDPSLALSVAGVESGYDSGAISHKGASGLMQVMPATAAMYGYSEEDLFDPEKNADAGVRYLSEMLQQHGGDETLALASYNAGPGAVAKYGGVPPYQETQDYIPKVQERRERLRNELGQFVAPEETPELPPTQSGDSFAGEYRPDSYYANQAAGGVTALGFVEEMEDPGHMKGLGAGVAKGLGEDVAFVGQIADWVGIDAGEALKDYMEEKVIIPMADIQQQYLAHGGAGRIAGQVVTEGGLIGAVGGLIGASGIAGLKAVEKIAAKAAAKGGRKAAVNTLEKAARKYGDEISEAAARLDDVAGEGYGSTIGEAAEKYSFSERVQRSAEKALTYLEDKWYPVYNVPEKELRKTTFRAMQRLRNMSGITTAPLVRGTYRVIRGTLTRTGDSYRHIWRDVAPEMRRDVSLYMDARRDRYLFRHRKDVKVSQESYDKSTQVLKDLWTVHGKDGMRYIRQKAEQHANWRIRSMLDPLYDAGILTEKAYAKFKGLKRNYSPFFRHGDKGNIADLITDEFLKEITGEVADTEEARQAILRAFSQFAEIGDPATGGKYVAPMRRVKKGAFDGERTPPLESDIKRVQQLGRIAERQQARNAAGRVLSESKRWEGRYLAVRELDDPAKFQKALKMDNSFVTFKNGERTVYVASDPGFIQAMESMTGATASVFESIVRSSGFKALSGGTRLFRKGIVMSPDFMVRNFTRDQLTAVMMSRSGYNPFDAVRGWADSLWGKTDIYDEYAAFMANSTMQEMNRIGADRMITSSEVIGRTGRTLMEKIRARRFGHEGGYLPQIEQIEKTGWARATANSFSELWANSKRELKAEHGILSLGGPFSQVAYLPFYMAGHLSEMFEKATRIGAVKRARSRAVKVAEGGSRKGSGYTRLASIDYAAGGLDGYLRAAGRLATGKSPFGGKFRERFRQFRDTPLDFAAQMDEAREITVDFQRKGYLGEMLNGLIPFSNVEFQDMSRLRRALAENPLSTTARGFSSITVPTILNWLKHYDDEAYHTQNTDIQKHLFFHLKRTDESLDDPVDAQIRIPRPVGVGNAVFGSPFDHFLNWVAMNKPELIVDVEAQFFPMTESEKQLRREEIAYKHRTNMQLLEAAALVIEESTPARWMDINIAQHLMPIAPFVNIASNYDPHMNRPIVPEGSTGNQEPLAVDVTGVTTGPTNQAIAEAIRWIANRPGIKESGILSDVQEINSMQVNHILNKFGGTVGRLAVTGISDPILERFAPNAYRVAPRVKTPAVRTPFNPARGFFSAPPSGGRSQSVRDFYDELDQLQKKEESLRRRTEAADYVGVGNLHSSDENLDVQISIAREGSRELGVLWDQWREIRTDPDLSDEDRAALLYLIDQRIAQVAMEFVDTLSYFKQGE